MKLRPILGEADFNCLKNIVESAKLNRTYRKPDRKRLSDFLAAVHVTIDETVLDDRIRLHDLVRLVSPLDSRDWCKLSIVPPEDANIAADRYSIFEPISLALMGRRCGEKVVWETSSGPRRMSIVSVTELADCMA